MSPTRALNALYHRNAAFMAAWSGVMDAGTSDSAQYNRWNEDNINVNVAASQTGLAGWYNTMCTGTRGLVLKVAGGVAALLTAFFLGYTTGYYVHNC
ncbi:unnamed protein product [Merluccius merluccius]